MTYLRILETATKRLAANLAKNPKSYQELMPTLGLVRNSKLLQQADPLFTPTIESYIDKLSQQQKFFLPELDAFGGLIKEDRSAEIKEAQSSVKALKPQLEKIKTHILQNTQYSESQAEEAIITTIESELLKEIAKIQSSKLSKLHKSSAQEKYDQKKLLQFLEQLPKTNSSILTDKGPRDYDQDRIKQLSLPTKQNSFQTIFQLQERLAKTHIESKELRGGSTSSIMAIKDGNMSISTSGDSLPIYFNVTKNNDGFTTTTLRLTASQDLNEPYFFQNVLMRGKEIEEKDRVLRVNGRAIASSIGDHDIGLGQCHFSMPVFYPNFTKTLKSQSLHFVVNTSDGIFYAGLSEHNYKSILSQYFTHHPENFDILIAGNDQEKIGEINKEIMGLIALTARNLGSEDNIALSCTLLNQILKKEHNPEITQISSVSDGHTKQGEKVAEKINEDLEKEIAQPNKKVAAEKVEKIEKKTQHNTL